jgi:hypothetical protein
LTPQPRYVSSFRSRWRRHDFLRATLPGFQFPAAGARRISVPCCGMLVASWHAAAQPFEHEAEIEASWARHLFDFLPAIEACIDASPEPASVLRAWPMDRGMIGMRLIDVLSAQWECVAPAVGGSVESFEPASGATEPHPPVEPVFTLAPGAPPPAGCYEHEEVSDASGEVVGWMSLHIC